MGTRQPAALTGLEELLAARAEEPRRVLAPWPDLDVSRLEALAMTALEARAEAGSCWRVRVEASHEPADASGGTGEGALDRRLVQLAGSPSWRLRVENPHCLSAELWTLVHGRLRSEGWGALASEWRSVLEIRGGDGAADLRRAPSLTLEWAVSEPRRCVLLPPSGGETSSLAASASEGESHLVLELAEGETLAIPEGWGVREQSPNPRALFSLVPRVESPGETVRRDAQRVLERIELPAAKEARSPVGPAASGGWSLANDLVAAADALDAALDRELHARWMERRTSCGLAPPPLREDGRRPSSGVRGVPGSPILTFDRNGQTIVAACGRSFVVDTSPEWEALVRRLNAGASVPADDEAWVGRALETLFAFRAIEIATDSR